MTVAYATAFPPSENGSASACGGGRQIVHLVNRTPAGPMRTKGSVITEAIPVHDLKLTFAGQIKTARLEPGGVDLTVEESDAGSVVRIARLDVHAMVIVE